MKIFAGALQQARALVKSPELLYSFSLIILIPVLLIFNSVIIINSFTDLVNYEVRDKAGLAASMLKNALRDTSNSSIQQRIEEISSRVVDSKGYVYFKQLDYVVKDSERFIVRASNRRDRINREIQPPADQTAKATDDDNRSYTQMNLTWSERRDIAIAATRDGERGYLVSSLVDDVYTKQRLAVVYAFVSYEHVDSLTQAAVTRALVALVVSVILVMLLLFNRSRVYQYSVLFKKLKDVDKMKDEFISIASHELRTPLTSIKGSLSMLMDEHNLSESEKRELIEMAEQSAEQLTTLVADLLDVSRIEQGRLQLKLEPVQLPEFITQIVTEIKVQADQKKLELTYQPTKLPIVTADKAKLRQVLVNLLGNAIKYTEHGSVTITAEEEGDMVALHIRDTGIGMTPEDRANLFKKFYRIRNDKTREITGTGLGLWITKQLVELGGGQIFVDSIEGSGTQIKITIPKAKS